MAARPKGSRPWAHRCRMSESASVPPLLAAPLPARAQDWSPTRPIRIVVGVAAGGATDISTRTIQPKLQSLLGLLNELKNVRP